MRIQRFRNFSNASSIVLAIASSWTSSTTTSAFTASSVFALNFNSAFTTTAATSFRGGSRSHSILNASEESINGETSEEPKKESSSKNSPKSTERPSTGWNHKLPDSTSKFWEGAKELPKNLAPETYSATSNSKERLKTGWLHKTEKEKPKQDPNQPKTSSGNKARKLLEQAMLDQKKNHRIISPPTFHPVGEGRRAVITEHKLAVPFDPTNSPSDPKAPESMVDIYFSVVELVTTPEEESFFQTLQATSSGASAKVKQREMTKRASDYKTYAKLKDAKECMLYLQGGPGFGAPVPVNGIGLSDKSSWVGAALSKGYKKIVLMDQRGTGRSSTITKQTLQKQFPDLFLLDNDVDMNTDTSTIVNVDSVSSMSSVNDEFANCKSDQVDKVKSALTEATDYMAQFRADNIVRDAEAVKEALLLPLDLDDDEESPPRPWGAALGQSFGGFCMMSYLSLIPNPPMICLLTGGIPPMLTNVDEAYSSLRERVKERNMKFYDQYPGDIDVVKRIVRRLDANPPKLPSGGVLTARRFLQLGIGLGGSPSAFASIHTLLSSAFVSDDDDDDDLSRAFLKSMDSEQPFDDHPIYFLMHESIYADDNSNCEKTSWSAYRAYENNGFDFKASCEADSMEPTLLTGEVIFPWMADGDYAELSGFGMRSLAHSLADKSDWPNLYNSENMKKALAIDGSGVSKAAAAVYYDDMYVDFDAVMKVTKRGNPLENCKVWISNEYQHSGLRDDGAMIFNKLLGMAKGEVGTPS